MHNERVAKPRIMQSAHDMVLSMGVVIATVAFLLAVTWRSHEQVVYPVDYAAAVQQAVQGAPFTVQVPQVTGYTATVARFEAESAGAPGAVRLYLGFVDGGGGYVLVWQSDGRPTAVVAAATNSAVCDADLSAAWTRCEAKRPETRAVVKVEDRVTTVVAGTVEWDALQSFADSLRPASGVQ